MRERSSTTLDISAVLLAAGASRRFGAAQKLLASLGGVPVVERVARALDASSIARVVAVTRPGDREIREVLEGFEGGEARQAASHVLPVWQIVENPDPDRGMGSSIAIGVTALPPHADGVMIVPGDMAGLDTAAIERLVAVYAAAGGGCIVHAANAEGEQSPPVIWPQRFLPRLAALRGDIGGKPMIVAERSTRPHSVIAVRFDDPQNLIDIDRPADLS